MTLFNLLVKQWKTQQPNQNCDYLYFLVKYISYNKHFVQTFSVRACGRAPTRAGAAIFVHSGAEGALKMCVRVRA